MTTSSLKIDGFLGMLTIRLQDDNFAKWSFQFRSVLEGYDLFEYFDGTNVCPPKYVVSVESGVTKEITAAYHEWIKTDKALLSLLIATLGDEAIEYVVGSKTAHETWTQLTDRYATYLLRLKHLKDQLLAAGESISENDLIVAALAEFRAQLLSAERTAEEYQSAMQFPMTGMFSQGESSATGAGRQFYQGENSNSRANRQFYQGESSTSQNYNGAGFSHRNHTGFNGSRFYTKPRFNAGNSGGFNNRCNGSFSGSSNNNRSNSTWTSWNGNTGNKDNTHERKE
ncbi:hypothetical protein D8674_022935 [Pyrus ussuriensis x Pyrus communis]|uniref:Retrotransposon Copia-like N-terminal domain-containing protein n=1 Tax=Pyrus ussuriensis x Pyrus communis TaxID=2448454 RepID=A0A5N5GMJ3_9ROSA|nr:hypothetical protein D8674_022935 [Pyrus ussuriensis x Pyrus communis]